MRSSAKRPGRRSAARLGAPPPSGGGVGVADNEPAVRTVAARMLERLGLRARCARDGRETLAVLREDPEGIACVLLDRTMPHMEGAGTLLEIRRLCPDISIVVCSGHSEPYAMQGLSGGDVSGFLKKPYTLRALREKLRATLG